MKTLSSGTCRVCGESLLMRSWNGGECDRCGCVSVDAVPTEEELDTYYQTTFKEKYTGGGRSGGRNLIRYARRYLQIIQPYVRRGKLIDVGSSKSPFPNLAAQAGFDVTVMDYSKPEGLNAQIHFAIGNLNDPDVLSHHRDAYDVVTSWAVLEHVQNPRLATEILAGMCRPGGLLFLSTPEIGTFITNNAIGRSGWFKPPMHLHLLSPSGLKRLFQQFNCRLIRWGRLELNPVRYAARYGLGLCEALAGWPLRLCGRSKWQILRDTKKQRFRGIAFYILKRNQPQ